MRIVIDINVLLISLPIKSPYRYIFDCIKSGKISLLVSNEILSEYEEKIGEKTLPEIAQNVVRLLLNLPDTEKTEIYYRWNLIVKDPDDDKYADCAVAGNAAYLVSDDRDFRVLKHVEFPKIELLTSDEFLFLLKKTLD
ncbi:MAG: putative toxin-antitoxin system toxin component, PIN family [Saprospiraceae bacterium]|nr:putative toxin-antitoxin system toxin component, PIN family [Saprospiraceae bacterium]